MRTIQEIKCEFWAGDLDMIEAIIDLEKIGYSLKSAEALVYEWEEACLEATGQNGV